MATLASRGKLMLMNLSSLVTDALHFKINKFTLKPFTWLQPITTWGRFHLVMLAMVATKTSNCAGH